MALTCVAQHFGLNDVTTSQRILKRPNDTKQPQIIFASLIKIHSESIQKLRKRCTLKNSYYKSMQEAMP